MLANKPLEKPCMCHPKLKFVSNSQQGRPGENERLPNEPFQVVFMFFISHSFGEAHPQEIQQPGAFPPGWCPTLKLQLTSPRGEVMRVRGLVGKVLRKLTRNIPTSPNQLFSILVTLVVAATCNTLRYFQCTCFCANHQVIYSSTCITKFTNTITRL